jgi:hypothetical protein
VKKILLLIISIFLYIPLFGASQGNTGGASWSSANSVTFTVQGSSTNNQMIFLNVGVANSDCSVTAAYNGINLTQWTLVNINGSMIDYIFYGYSNNTTSCNVTVTVSAITDISASAALFYGEPMTLVKKNVVVGPPYMSIVATPVTPGDWFIGNFTQQCAVPTITTNQNMSVVNSSNTVNMSSAIAYTLSQSNTFTFAMYSSNSVSNTVFNMNEISGTVFTQTYTPTPTIVPTFTPTLTPLTPCISSNLSDEYLCSSCSNNMNSIGGAGSATIIGSPSFYTSPAPPNSGTYSIGNFTTSNYITFSTLQKSSLSNTSSGTIDFEWYMTDASSVQMPLSWHDDFWSGTMYLYYNGANFLLAFPSGAAVTLEGSPTINTWHEYTFSWSSDGHLYFWFDKVLKYAGYGLNSVGHFMSNITQLSLGANTSDGSPNHPCSGYICQIKFSNSSVISPPFIDGCGFTPIPTITPFATYFKTPTAVRTLAPQCSAPWPQVFTPCSSPVLTPNLSPETISEPDMIYCPTDNKMHLISSREVQSPMNYTVVLATSSNLNVITGGNFVDQGTLVGNGVCGIANACMAKQVHMNGFDRLYFRNMADGNIWRLDSYDSGYHYITSTAAIALNLNTLLPFSLYTSPGMFSSFDATSVFPDPNGNSNDYYAMAELSLSSNFGSLGQYPIWLFYSTDSGNTFNPISPVPLYSMAAPTLGNIYAHPRSLTYTSTTGLYDVFEGVGFSGPIVHVKSYDLYNWRPDTAATLSVSGLPQVNWPPMGWNQIGDTGGLVTWNGYTYMPFSEEMQDGSNGVVGLAVFSGSIENYDNCLLTTPTNTPVNSFTPTFTSTITATSSITPTATLTSTITATATITPITTPFLQYTGTDIYKHVHVRWPNSDTSCTYLIQYGLSLEESESLTQYYNQSLSNNYFEISVPELLQGQTNEIRVTQYNNNYNAIVSNIVIVTPTPIPLDIIVTPTPG